MEFLRYIGTLDGQKCVVTSKGIYNNLQLTTKVKEVSEYEGYYRGRVNYRTRRGGNLVFNALLPKGKCIWNLDRVGSLHLTSINYTDLQTLELLEEFKND